MPRLSLDSLTLTDTPPQTLIRAAAEAGFDACSLWIIPPPLFPSPLLTPALEHECAAIIADTGIEVIALEVFDLHSIAGVESCKPLLEMGARLGGKAALAINYSNADRGETAEILARFAEAAAGFGLATNLEPIAAGQTQTLAQGLDLIRRSGADVGICFDPHHLLRSGGGLADLQAVPPGAIRYVQVCDGPIPQPPEIAMTEAVCERLYPGDGDFPLVELLRAAPRDVPVGIECPSLRRAQSGMSAADQAREVIAKVRKLLATLD
ncbi:MAG: sugar phosphate isomerase/epimerase [Sphingomonadales bacterium]|nr:sugar phosphate isomerase/epimerase [Sphingomonadales bacterium]